MHARKARFAKIRGGFSVPSAVFSYGTIWSDSAMIPWDRGPRPYQIREYCDGILRQLAFGQKFQDVSAKGAPVFLLVKHDHADTRPYAAVRNNSTKGILAMIAIVKTTDENGHIGPW